MSSCVFQPPPHPVNISFPEEGICTHCRQNGVAITEVINRTLDGSLERLANQVGRVTSFVTFTNLVVYPYIIDDDDNRVLFDVMFDGDTLDTISYSTSDGRFGPLEKDGVHLVFPVDDDQAIGFINGALSFMQNSNKRAQRDAANLRPIASIKTNINLPEFG